MFLAIILIFIGLVIPVTVEPDQDSRVILDHTLNVYSAPSCFDQAELTNNLEETTLAVASENDFEPESECTEEAFRGERASLIISWFRQ